MGYALISLALVADATAASRTLTTLIAPTVTVLCVLASLVCAGFTVHAGLQMIGSSGSPEKLGQAKLVLRNALIGLVVILGAATVTQLFSNTYQRSGNATTQSQVLPIKEIKPAESSGGLVDVLINAIIGLLRSIIETAAKPFVEGLQFFVKGTPLMSANASVFNMWLVVLAIANVLFGLVVILLGFKIMSFASLGLEEIEFKHLIPQLLFIFIIMNSSIFIIDGIIALSNWMIQAVQVGISTSSVWDSLMKVANESKDMKLAALFIMIVFIILTVTLLVYYLLRLVTLFIGAVLSPLVTLLWLVPGFKDFCESAAKSYLTTIFVLFIHVIILALASSLFTGMIASSPGEALDPIMSMLIGIATLLALLKTQSVLAQYALVSTGARGMRKLGGQFVNGVSYMAGQSKRMAHASAASRPVSSPLAPPTIIRIKGAKQ